MLHIISSLAVGGAEQALYRVLKGGLATSFDNRVVSLKSHGAFSEKIREVGVQVDALGAGHPIASFFAIKDLYDIVQEFSPDIIQGWMYHGNFVARIAWRMTRDQSHLVWNVRHSLYDLADEKLFTRQVIRANRYWSPEVSTIIYNSRLSNVQHEKFGFRPESGVVIPNGFDMSVHFSSAANNFNVRDELSIPHSALVVGHVGRYHPVKNHEGFLRAVAEIIGDRKDVHVILAGRGVDSGNDKLVNLLPKAVRDRVYFLGERSDVPRLMCAMDLLCVSSFSEAFPNVLAEAMATGIPCVSTNVGDSAIIIGDEGLLAKANDSSDFLNCLQSMLAMTGSDRRAMGQRARCRIEKFYSLGGVVEKYTGLYLSLLAQEVRKA
ncbi:glycosyltransferase [Salinisphaera aquimarina]|uniref:Glycosyltransferase n=1 Tax=Salinisphaera aquimarina TaxID=2094031 RepID=A0ABV7ESB8_9GAMM